MTYMVLRDYPPLFEMKINEQHFSRRPLNTFGTDVHLTLGKQGEYD